MAELSKEIMDYHPDLIIAIGGGGYIPARMLRTHLNIPLYAVSLELYDDSTNSRRGEIIKRQWLDNVDIVYGKRILIVDEIDDSRTTLAYTVKEMEKHSPQSIAVAVVHNKKKEKSAQLGNNTVYFCAQEINDQWIVYPWENISN